MKPLRFTCVLLALASLAAAQEPAATDADAKAALDSWNEAAKIGTDEAKEMGIEKLAACRHAMTAAKLGWLATVESEDLRVACAKALGKMGGFADAAKALHGAIKANEANKKVHGAIFDAIADVNHPSSVAVCKDWASDRVSHRDWEDVPIITAAIEALGGLKWKSAVEALLDLWQKNKVVDRKSDGFRSKVRSACSQALRRLTGEKLGNLDEWEGWWKAEKGKLREDLTPR
ncbi:MAG: hypothetical protein HYY18_18270 [Planctomycetes bacterium]|nr:hypothetical protein [Planctomycetota bacterium]